jgi:hypothetical protein
MARGAVRIAHGRLGLLFHDSIFTGPKVLRKQVMVAWPKRVTQGMTPDMDSREALQVQTSARLTAQVVAGKVPLVQH